MPHGLNCETTISNLESVIKLRLKRTVDEYNFVFLDFTSYKIEDNFQTCNWTQVVKFMAEFKLAYHKAKCISMLCTANYYFDFKGATFLENISLA